MKLIGRYEIITLIGSGGFGQVYLAHDPFTKRIMSQVKTIKLYLKIMKTPTALRY